MLRTFPSFVAAVTAMLLAFPAASAELAIGTRAPPAVDPHYQWLGTNEAYSQHMFEALVRKDAKGTWLPALATSWRQVDELTWDFTLRKGVKFHDGSEFTAEDVVFTFNRVPNIPNNPNPYTVNIRPVAKVETPDPYTARLKLSAPDPLVAGPLSSVFIVSHAAAKDATPADFQSGKAAIGTGPYKFVSYTPDDRLVLARNDAYLGRRPGLGQGDVPDHQQRCLARRGATRRRCRRHRLRAARRREAAGSQPEPRRPQGPLGPPHVPRHRCRAPADARCDRCRG